MKISGPPTRHGSNMGTVIGATEGPASSITRCLSYDLTQMRGGDFAKLIDEILPTLRRMPRSPDNGAQKHMRAI